MSQRRYFLKPKRNQTKRMIISTRKHRLNRLRHTLIHRISPSRSKSPFQVRNRFHSSRLFARPSSAQRHVSPIKSQNLMFGQIRRSMSPARRSTSPTRRSMSPMNRMYGGRNNLVAPSHTQKFNPQHELRGAFIRYNPSVSSSCPNIFKPTYVLSIRTERMNNFTQRFSPWMPFMKRSQCVIGAHLNKEKLVRDKTITRTMASKLKLGQIGCFLSHMNAWKCIANAPYEFGTILEDDADIRLSSAQKINESMKELSDKHISWDILFWCISPIPHVAASLQECKHLKNWKKIPPNACMGGIAYTIKKHVARAWVNRFHGITEPSDLWIARTFGQFHTYCINPILGFMVLTKESDTEHSTSPKYNKYLKRR